MAGHIPEHIIAQVKSATDIVDIISQYVPLQKKGRDFKALCPFHDEKSPSFSVSPEKQIFRCFGCGEGGSVFRFLMLHERMTFPEAVKYLAEKVGITIPEENVDRRKSEAEKNERLAIYNALAKAADFYVATLLSPAGRNAREYLKQRRIGATTAELWRLGFAPTSWEALHRHLQAHNIPAEIQLKAGLVSARETGGYYDRFRARLMFPIRDVRDRVVGFGARTLDPEGSPKYLNSPETPVFDKSSCLYGLHRAATAARDRGLIAVVEGYTDVLMAHQLGVTYVVATLGTALTLQHIRLIRRYATKVVIVFDADAAGQKASDRSIDLFLMEDMDLGIAVLPSGLDPCDFLLQEGANAFDDLVRQARGILEFKLKLVRDKYDLSKLDEHARAVDEVLTIVPAISNPVKKDLYLREVSSALNVSENTLRSRLPRIARAYRVRETTSTQEAKPPPKDAAFKAQKDIITFLLHFPGDAAFIFHEVAPGEFSNRALRTLFQAVHDVFESEGTILPDNVINLLEARGDEVDALRIASGILLEHVDKELLLRRVRGSIAWFTKQRKRKEVQELRRQLKEARARGDSAAVQQLLKEAQAQVVSSSAG